jgi:hypothetical protein
MQPLIIRNRLITDATLNQIRNTIDAHWNKGRTHISHILCEEWNWRQANGSIKGIACRDLLLRLERMDLIKLPPSRRFISNRKKILPISLVSHAEPMTGRVDEFNQIDIELAASTDKRKLWDSLVHEYHYLGSKHIVGSCLKYFVYLEGQLVCLLGWGSAAWKVGCRDNFIGWNAELRRIRLNSIANNVRFLILPWVKIQHLASKVLALSRHVLAIDWQGKFSEELVLLETFVDQSRFQGTCYRAANWIYLGVTKGSGKSGASYHHHGIIKSVFVYPLKPDFRRRLCR